MVDQRWKAAVGVEGCEGRFLVYNWIDRTLILGTKGMGFAGAVTAVRVMKEDMVFKTKLFEDEGNFPRVRTVAGVESELLSVVCGHFEDWNLGVWEG